VPAFFLALARTHGPVRERDFLPELRRFAIPAGVIVGVAIAATYLVARAVGSPTLEQARSTTLIAALVVSLAVLCAVARGEEGARLPRWLVGYVIAVAAVTPLLPRLSWFSSFFAVVWPPLPQLAVAAVGGLAGVLAIELLQRLRVQRARSARAPAA
jgi:branched-subunit amino acid permease